MNFTVDCTCGRTIQVTAAHAGSDVRCVCGKVQAVPALSELRRRAGRASCAVNIAEKIRYMVADGQLPADDKCVSCGITTDSVLKCIVECERPAPKSPRFWDTLLLNLLSPASVLLGEFSRMERETEMVGRENLVKAPLRLCPHCAAEAANSNRRDELVNLLNRVPLYRRLLQEYPAAYVAIS